MFQAERRNATAGLGMRGANYNIEDTDNYKDALRKTMFARYKEIEWKDNDKIVGMLFLSATWKDTLW